MDDDRLGKELRKLPRASASAGFTEEVLDQLEAPSVVERPAAQRWMVLAVAALVIAVLAPLGVWRWQERRRVLVETEIATLRADQEALRAQLTMLQRQVDRRQRVVVLGGDDEVDYVLDLGRLRPARVVPTPTPPRIFRTGGSL